MYFNHKWTKRAQNAAPRQDFNPGGTPLNVYEELSRHQGSSIIEIKVMATILSAAERPSQTTNAKMNKAQLTGCVNKLLATIDKASCTPENATESAQFYDF